MAGHWSVELADDAVRHHGPVLLRVLTWNVNGAGADRRGAQGAFLASCDVDIALLTETRHGTATKDYAAWLAESGLGHQATGFAQAAATGAASGDPVIHVGSRRYGVLLAARWPLVAQPPLTDAPWPERVIDVVVAIPQHPVRVFGLYAPIGLHGSLKDETFEAIARRLATVSGSIVVCGDLNAPQYEGVDADGRPVIATFGQRRRKSGDFGAAGSRTDLAERLLLDGGPTGLTDAFRAIHGYEVAESSWSAFRPGRRFDYRLDHVLVRGGLVPVAARYSQDARERRPDGVRLSDHAVLEVTLELPG